MSRGSSDIDLDRLADYAAGLLAGAEADQVARLIHTDPRWSAGYHGLVAADQAVRNDLAGYAHAQDEPMPAAVAARLDAALRGADQTTGARSATVSSLAAARARRRRITGLAAAAAAVFAIAGGGWVASDIVGERSTGPQPSLGQRQEGAAVGPGQPPAAAPGPPAGPTVLASGMDYRRETLGKFADRFAQPGRLGADASQPRLPAGSTPAPGAQAVPRDVTGPLSRLADPGQLRDCLAAVATVHPGTTRAVDFARFDGEPALILLVQRPDGPSIVVAVGSSCGLAGADERAAVPA